MPRFNVRTLSVFEHVYEVFADSQENANELVQEMLDVDATKTMEMEIKQTFITETVIPD